MARTCGEIKHGQATGVRDHNACAHAEKRVRDSVSAVFQNDVQRRVASVVHRIRDGARCEKLSDDIDVASSCTSCWLR